MKSNKIFLGGTCNETRWRNELIPFLKLQKLEYFNPVVNDWNKEAQEEERRQKKECGIHLYTVTPAMTGVFSIFEIAQSLYLYGPDGYKTWFCVLPYEKETIFKEWTTGQWKSLLAVIEEVEKPSRGFVYRPTFTIKDYNLTMCMGSLAFLIANRH